MTETMPPLPTVCWPVDWSCAETPWLETLDDATKDRAEALAASTLRALTAYQVGGCPITVRPCAQGCGGGTYVAALVPGGATGALGGRVGPWWAHVGTDGQWVNTSCGCTTECSCTTVPEVILPAPVGKVVAVTIDGARLDPQAYRVDNGNHLVRQDGGDWPKCQDMASHAGTPGTFTVEYLNAWVVDGLGAFAAGKLAIEFAKACMGAKCRLPVRVQSITRMGVSMEVSDSTFSEGTTGIAEVDAYIRIWNPNFLSMPSQVWSPDLPTARRTTWGTP